MDENERYEQVCKPQLQRMESMLTDIHKRLFVGNGTPPVMHRLSALEAVAHPPRPTEDEQPWYKRAIVLDLSKLAGAGTVGALAARLLSLFGGGGGGQ